MSVDLKKVWDHVVKYRVPHVQEDFPLILFWSQKSGCTTLAKWFYDQIGLLDEALAYNEWIHFYDQEVYKNKANYRDKLFEIAVSEEKDAFKLVRNPYTRAVSQFMILLTSKSLYWNQEWEKIRSVLYGDKDRKKGITFKQFLGYIRDHQEMADNHFHPQYTEGEENFVQHYIHLENFTTEIKQLESTYQLKNSNIKKLANSSHHMKKSMVLKGDWADRELTNESFIGIGRFPTYESFYDKEAIRLVNDIFQKDFEIYGYERRSGS